MRDQFGLLPPEIRARLEREDVIDRHRRSAVELSKMLRQIDEHLSVVWVKSDIHPDDLPFGAKPGRWHIERKNPSIGVPTYRAIEGPNGEYREPDYYSLADELGATDMTRRGQSADDIMRTLDARRARQRRHKDLTDEQRRDHMKEDYRAAKRVAGETLTKRRWGAK